MTSKKIFKINIEREPILSPKARAIARKISSDRKLSIKFLKKIGLLTASGKPSPLYYG